jgi:hypothetical protein
MNDHLKYDELLKKQLDSIDRAEIALVKEDLEESERLKRLARTYFDEWKKQFPKYPKPVYVKD